MAADHIAVIEREAARILAAYAVNPGGEVPWSDRWSMGTVPCHVAGAHHVVAQIIEDRPTADFGRFESLDPPVTGDPGFPAWFAVGTAALVAQCRTGCRAGVDDTPPVAHRGHWPDGSSVVAAASPPTESRYRAWTAANRYCSTAIACF